MGYEFTLDIAGFQDRDVDKGDMDKVEACLREMDIIGYALNRDSFTEDRFYSSGPALWSQHETDMRHLSAQFP